MCGKKADNIIGYIEKEKAQFHEKWTALKKQKAGNQT